MIEVNPKTCPALPILMCCGLLVVSLCGCASYDKRTEGFYCLAIYDKHQANPKGLKEIERVYAETDNQTLKLEIANWLAEVHLRQRGNYRKGIAFQSDAEMILAEASESNLDRDQVFDLKQTYQCKIASPIRIVGAPLIFGIGLGLDVCYPFMQMDPNYGYNRWRVGLQWFTGSIRYRYRPEYQHTPQQWTRNEFENSIFAVHEARLRAFQEAPLYRTLPEIRAQVEERQQWITNLLSY